jgi:hypothetical protein
MSKRARFRLLVLGVALVSGPAPELRGEDRIQFDGISMSVPASWIARDPAIVRSQVQERAAEADIQSIVGVWGERCLDGYGANLSLSRRSGYMTVSAAEIPRAQKLLEQELGRFSGIKSFLIRDLRIVEVDGLPAYRIRTHLEVFGNPVEQLQYVVAGGKTYILTFSCLEEQFREKEPQFEEVLRSVYLEDRPTLLQTAPVGLWGGVVGGLLSAALALKQRGRPRAA